MSVAATDHHTIDETATQRHGADVVDVAAWLSHSASLRQPVTEEYVPRHRADGPAI